MARILKKIPDFKLPKYKMKEVGDLEELRMEYAEKNIEDMKKRMERHHAQENYPGTHYRTVKEFFLRSTELYKERPFILQTFNKKEGFREISYGQFRRDVNDFGTALTRVLNLEGEKVMILSETTYEWYVSYTALLWGAGIAVPTDKDLPDNELENLMRRSGARAIIFSSKKKDAVKKAAAH